MFSSEDEQYDSNVFDQLKSIRPFTVDQLYLLHSDVIRPTTQLTQQDFETTKELFHDNELFQNLVDFEQNRIKLVELSEQVKFLHKKTFDHVDQAWILKEETIRKVGLCQQGKIAETTFRFKQATLNAKQLEIFSVSFSEMIEVINKDYIHYSFESRMKKYKITSRLLNIYHIIDSNERSYKLKLSIATLTDFLKHLSDSKSEFALQCRKWLRALIKKFLEINTTDHYQFIIIQLTKGPSGTADWSADLIECKPFDYVHGFDSVPNYISHCSALLDELFNGIKLRLNRLSSNNCDNVVTNNSPEHNWSLIDPRFNCSEELNLHGAIGNTLSESDVIKLCLRIPVAQIFRTYVKKCLASDEFRLEIDKNYEYIMLKLITLGTLIIKTYQKGLETFNSIQYGNLIEYLSSQIRRIVITLSEQWTEFKRRLKGIDDALLMRLQVEYDNFILRSILIILELRQSGIWRHLSQFGQENLNENLSPNSWSADSLRPAFYKLLQVTGLASPASSSDQTNELETCHKSQHIKLSSSLTHEFSIDWFKEVSEPMLWHILWQFYHKAFVNLCDYHSDSYWLSKFREKSVVYLFVNKIKDYPPGECSYLLNSITSLALSRTRSDSKLIEFIATEIFDLSFKHKSLKAKITKIGTKCLIRCAEKFPVLISLFMNFMIDNELEEEVIDLFKNLSLKGWICNDDEAAIIANWIIERPITSTYNKIARILLSKLLLNSPEVRTNSDLNPAKDTEESNRTSPTKMRVKSKSCFVNLKLRRKIALMLYEACIYHKPDNDISLQSLGASVEVAFGGLFCEKNSISHSNLIELALDANYQQFYIWCWRILFTLRLHILNQTETDWNDVQSRSGTSRSIKNTVLVNDSFHPVPSIQDSECLSILEGMKNHHPVASFIYLVMTDAAWKTDSLDSCLDNLNIMAKSGHLTPSLMAMKYLTICHLDDLSETLLKDQKCLEYFTIMITSNFDITRLSSLIMSQINHLKQYRQLQLSQFYIKIFIEIASNIIKQTSSSWFSGDELSLEKIACLLDYIVKFNFPTQRLEIILKFFDCSYSVQAGTTSNSWFGSLFASNSLNANSTRRDFLTTLHILTQKFKRFTWLKWVTAECDTLRLEKIWEDLVVALSNDEVTNLDSAIKRVCPHLNPTILKSLLPIYSWIKQIFEIMETDLNHPLCPLVWYNFFLNYFANSLNGVSVGVKLVAPEILLKLNSRLESLFNYHLYKHRNWSSGGSPQQNSLAQLYKAYKLWLQDSSLRDAYVDMDRLSSDYLVSLLKAVMESSNADSCIQYIDVRGLEIQNKNLIQVWSTATTLEGNQLIKDMIFVGHSQDDSMEILTSVEGEASDAVSLIVKSYQIDSDQNDSSVNTDDEFKIVAKETSYDTSCDTSFDELIDSIKKNFGVAFEESAMFCSSLTEIDKTKSGIIDLIKQLYLNKKKELIRVVSCAEGNECPGPARIKCEVKEAAMDERKSQCIQDRRRQCNELITEFLSMPTSNIVQSTVIIEDHSKMLVNNSKHSKKAIEIILDWISDPNSFQHLTGQYYVSNHLLKSILEILSTSDQVDTYNIHLIGICFKHPKSVQVFGPFLSPSLCTQECFLSLYKQVSQELQKLGPISMFVILSKFDINNWLNNVRSKNLHHELIKTTCKALSLMGKEIEDGFSLTFELYKRHIHFELAAPDRRKPEEIKIILNEFLQMMAQRTLVPSLWIDFVKILGLENNVQPNLMNRNETTIGLRTPSKHKEVLAYNLGNFDYENSNMADLIKSVSQVADFQMTLDYHSLNDLMKTLIQFTDTMKDTINVTPLEYYEEYLNEFSIVMISVTFMWLKVVGEQYPDNFDLTWKSFIDLWYDWIFLSKNCQNVSKDNYSLMANHFVAALRFMIQKMPDDTQNLLHSILSTLTEYVGQTKEVVYLELTILQRCLKYLPWSNFIAIEEDFDNLCILSEQENFNISDLISHIMLQINMKNSLSNIQEKNPSALPHILERLSISIIIQSAFLKSFRLHGVLFTQIPVDRVSRIAKLILPRMEFVNLEHSQTNKLLVNLLRFTCIKLDSSTTLHQSNYLDLEDSVNRSMIYAQFVSDYLIDLTKNHPNVLEDHKQYLSAVMDNSLQDLKILISPDIELSKKTTIYGYLFECLNHENLPEEVRIFFAETLLKSQLVKNRPIVVLEIFHAIGQIIRDGHILVYLIEKLISIYLNLNGHYEKILKSFCLRVLPSDLYLGACVEKNASLALVVYFEALYRNGQVSNQCSIDHLMSPSATPFNDIANTEFKVSKIWSSFFHWIAQLDIQRDSIEKFDDTKLVIAWLKLSEIFEPQMQSFMFNEHQSMLNTINNEPNTKANDTDSEKTSNSSSHLTNNTESESKSDKQPVSITASHKSFLNFMKHLISIYDSANSTGLWSYIRSASLRTDQTSRTALVALSIACLLLDRGLMCFNANKASEDSNLTEKQKALQNEMLKLRKICLSKLELARKSKNYLDCVQFTEALIESINRNDKVQYSESIQLVAAFVRSHQSISDENLTCINKILPLLN